MPWDIYAARAALHMWEEPCISGENGSGAVFFSGCTLKCVFCQNKEISGGNGRITDISHLADIFLNLQEQRANNINLVTPTMYTMQIIEAVKLAKQKGLRLPIVYNTSGYERVETLKMLEGIVDVYLPDMKYYSSALSAKYSGAEDYFEAAAAALDEMVRQTGKAQFADKETAEEKGIEEGVMCRGVIVRHLILPNHTKDSKNVIKYLYEKYKNDIFISIMNQYTPLPHVASYPELNRKITKREYDAVVDYAIDLGVTNGFIQENGTAAESFIPAFDYSGM
jgi:putative pyruvate formate lyase activating enzyme